VKQARVGSKNFAADMDGFAAELKELRVRADAQIARLKREAALDKEWSERLRRCGMGTSRREEFVYLIRCASTNYYKIGLSVDPRSRLKQLQGATPSPLHLRLTIPARCGGFLEQALHAHFRSKRVRGEWFALDLADVAELVAGRLPPEAARWAG
jgi:hypothetical protein